MITCFPLSQAECTGETRIDSQVGLREGTPGRGGGEPLKPRLEQVPQFCRGKELSHDSQVMMSGDSQSLLAGISKPLNHTITD